ncbi:hypothetical protein [Actinoplanes sp. NPDC049316]|uniref:hypothetical protein n=1 Tax=Actinoplanes sp. NPDC049316 TaxID=3154727 RepID=UPI0034176F11
MPETHADGPQRYRLRIFDGNYEILTDRLFQVVLDLATPAGQLAADAALTPWWRAACRLARLRGEQADAVRLQVHEWGTGGPKVFDWIPR